MRVVEFLPSEEGLGFSATIGTPSEKDNKDEFWQKRGYNDLRGVAVEPTVELDEWGREIYDRLKLQGTIFIAPRQIDKYKKYLAPKRRNYFKKGKVGKKIMNMLTYTPISEEETRRFLDSLPD